MADLTKHSMLKPVRLSAKCYDKHFAFLDVFTSNEEKVYMVKKGLILREF